jgi:hypothetical protein
MRIEVTVASDGSTGIQTYGFAGRGCLDATRRLEAALGHTTSDRLTREFYHEAGQRAGTQLPAREGGSGAG